MDPYQQPQGGAPTENLPDEGNEQWSSVEGAPEFIPAAPTGDSAKETQSQPHGEAKGPAEVTDTGVDQADCSGVEGKAKEEKAEETVKGDEVDEVEKKEPEDEVVESS